MSLFLHCGADRQSLESIRALPIPDPVGPRHQPYSFAEYADHVKEALSGVGMEVIEEDYAVQDNRKFFGLLSLRSDYNDYTPIVGLRGSHDQSLPRAIALGQQVFVCDNLSFTGERVLSTKQTKRIAERIPKLINNAITDFPSLIEAQNTFIHDLRSYKLSRSEADAAITEIIRRGIVTPSRAGQLIEQWDRPEHEEHAEDGRSLWRLHNAVTQVLKPVGEPSKHHLDTLRARTLKLTALCHQIAKPEASVLEAA